MKLPINYEKSHWTTRKQAREQYVVEQSGMCKFCGEPLNGKPRPDVDAKWINVKLFPPSSRSNTLIHLCDLDGVDNRGSSRKM